MDEKRDGSVDPRAPAASSDAVDEIDAPATLPIDADNLPRPPSAPSEARARPRRMLHASDEGEDEITAVFDGHHGGQRTPPQPPAMAAPMMPAEVETVKAPLMPSPPAKVARAAFGRTPEESTSVFTLPQ